MIIPEKNKKDLYDIPKNVKSRLKFTIVRDVSQVLEIALEPAPDEPDTPESDDLETQAPESKTPADQTDTGQGRPA